MTRYRWIPLLLLSLTPVAYPSARPPRQTPPDARPSMAAVDPALLNGLKYRRGGPSRGGRVTTVTGVPSQPRTLNMGVASGGLFGTTDGGSTSTALTER